MQQWSASNCMIWLWSAINSFRQMRWPSLFREAMTSWWWLLNKILLENVRLISKFPDVDNSQKPHPGISFAWLTNGTKIFMLFLYVDVVFVEKSRYFSGNVIFYRGKTILLGYEKWSKICRIILRKKKPEGKRY